MKPHKHAELIKAWADGAEIQVRTYGCDEWHDQKHPWWDDHLYEYRIKPEPKPDVVKYLNELKPKKDCDKCWEESDYHITKNCVAIIFDGETGELKSAEVLK